MNHKRLLPVIALILLLPCLSLAQEAKERGLASISKQAVQGQLEFLASDWTEGRHTGRPGAYLAADYIASLFKVYGLEAGGDTKSIQPGWEERRQGKNPISYRTFFQDFDLVEIQTGRTPGVVPGHPNRRGDPPLHLRLPDRFLGRGFRCGG